MQDWKPTPLPLTIDVETKSILKKATRVHRYLAELKGIAETIPNQGILLNTLSIQEAKDSSEVENIVTTHDELYRAGLEMVKEQSVAAKEVQNYTSALKRGFQRVGKNGILTLNHIVEIQSCLEQNKAGLRKIPGTALRNQATKEIVYTPPQHPEEILDLMVNLVNYINDDSMSDVDEVVKVAIVHFQFESIHPFFDGNGRTGRIVNVLFLILKNILSIPVLYLSRYINQNKGEYYKRIQRVRDEGDWESWIMFMLDAMEQTAVYTIYLIREIRGMMMTYKNVIRQTYKFYSQDLLNNLFKHPYTKIEFLMEDLQISRPTASGYLNRLAEDGLVEKRSMGKYRYFVNTPLVNLLSEPTLLPITI